MELLFLLLILTFVSVIYFAVKHGNAARKRAEFIDAYHFPEKLKVGVLKTHPQLSKAQANRVVETLREYFHVCNEGGKDFISMPSEAVDTAWHEFILFTRQYATFCDKAFGRFLHHTPAEGLSKPALVQKGLRNAWRIACSRVNVDPASPSKLPMLFSIDAMYKIVDGYHYEIDCKTLTAGVDKKSTYCVTHTLASKSGGCGGCGGHVSSPGDSSGGDAGCGSGCGGCGG